MVITLSVVRFDRLTYWDNELLGISRASCHDPKHKKAASVTRAAFLFYD